MRRRYLDGARESSYIQNILKLQIMRRGNSVNDSSPCSRSCFTKTKVYFRKTQASSPLYDLQCGKQNSHNVLLELCHHPADESLPGQQVRIFHVPHGLGEGDDSITSRFNSMQL